MNPSVNEKLVMDPPDKKAWEKCYTKNFPMAETYLAHVR